MHTVGSRMRDAPTDFVIEMLKSRRMIPGVQDLLPKLLIWGDCYLPRCDRVDLRTSVSGQVIDAAGP